MGIDQKVIFATCHLTPDSHLGPGEKLLSESMNALANACKGKKDFEFLILCDDFLYDVVGSNQRFFEYQLEKAFTEVNIHNLKITGLCAGGIDFAKEVIQRKYPKWIPDFRIPCNDPGCVLYSIEPK